MLISVPSHLVAILMWHYNAYSKTLLSQCCVSIASQLSLVNKRLSSQWLGRETEAGLWGSKLALSSSFLLLPNSSTGRQGPPSGCCPAGEAEKVWEQLLEDAASLEAGLPQGNPQNGQHLYRVRKRFKGRFAWEVLQEGEEDSIEGEWRTV